MKNRSIQSGFTLLEVIVSLVILTIALTAIVTVGSNRAETLLELQQRNSALLVANNVLERYSIPSQALSPSIVWMYVSVMTMTLIMHKHNWWVSNGIDEKDLKY